MSYLTGNKKFSLNVLLIIVLLLSLNGSLSAQSDNVSKIDKKLEKKIERVQKKLDILNKKYEGTTTVSITPSAQKSLSQFDGYSEMELETYLTKIYEDTKKITYEVTIEPEDIPNNPNSIDSQKTNISSSAALTSSMTSASNTTYSNRIANVNFSVPAIGYCNLGIRFDSTLDPNVYFVSGKVNNSLINSGFCIGGWAHDYGDFIVSYYRTYATIKVYGVLSYGIGSFSIHTNQSVQYIDSWTNY